MDTERAEQVIWNFAETITDPEELTGSFRVRMWWWFRNRKVINGVRGLNIAYGAIPWGKFAVLAAKGKELTLRYDDGVINDLIRRISHERYIGKFYRNGKFERYFRLERIGE